MTEQESDSSAGAAGGLDCHPVLVLATRLNEYGGIQSHTRNVRDGLAAAGRHVELIAIAAEDDEPGSVVSAAGSRLKFASLAWRATRRLNRPILVLAHLQFVPVYLVLMSLGLVRRGHAIVLVHGLELPIYLSKINRLAIRLSRLAIAPNSNDTRRQIVDTYGLQALPPVFCAATKPDPSAASAPWPRPGDCLEVITISRLTRAVGTHKNVDLAMKAVAEAAAKSNQPIRHTIIGEGPDAHRLQRMARGLDHAEYVFVGAVTDKEKARLLERSHIFLLPSTTDGFGIVVLEAWQAGLAVVGSCEGGIGEVVDYGEAGLAPPADVSAIANAIISLIQDPHLRSNLAKNATRQLGRFSLKKLHLRIEHAVATVSKL